MEKLTNPTLEAFKADERFDGSRYDLWLDIRQYLRVDNKKYSSLTTDQKTEMLTKINLRWFQDGKIPSCCDFEHFRSHCNTVYGMVNKYKGNFLGCKKRIDNIMKPLHNFAEPKTKKRKSTSNTAYNKEWEDLTNRSQMLLTDEIVEGIEKISREQNVCITTLIDYIGQRCRERRENYQTLPGTTQSVICDPLSNTNTNDNIKHEIKEEMDHEIKEEVIDDDPLCVDYGTKVEDDLDIKEHNIEI